MKKNKSDIYTIKNKEFSPIIKNKNNTTIRFGDIKTKKNKRNDFNINYHFKEKKNINNMTNISKKKSLLKQNIIKNLNKKLHELKNNNHLNNKNIIKYKTPTNSSYKLKPKSDSFYRFNNIDDEKTNKISKEFKKNNLTKVDNSSNKSNFAITKLLRKRSVQNIQYSELNLFRNYRLNNNSNSSFLNYNNNIFNNCYLNHLNKNRFPIKNVNNDKYYNCRNCYQFEKEKYINNKKTYSKDKNTQVSFIENYSKNDKKEKYILFNPNDLLSKTINNFDIKKYLVLKDNNIIKNGNSDKITKQKRKLPKNIKMKNLTPDAQNNNKEINQKKDDNKLININEEQKQNTKYNKENIDSDKKYIKERIKAYNAITQAGIDKNFYKKINQDNYIISTNINNITNFNIFGVLDGHGLYGHLISIFVGKYILNCFIHNKELKSCKNTEELYTKLKKNNFQIINEIFINAEKELYKVEFDSNFSGTTCIIVIEVENHIICANTGDSRAILIYTEEEEINNYIQENNINNEEEIKSKEDNIINSHYQIKNIIRPFSNIRRNSTFSLDNKKRRNIRNKNKKSFNLLTKIFFLSYDLKPNLPLEKKRIYKSGGRVEQFKEKDGNMNGPPRVWVKDEMFPGLAMSRSIGDFIASSVGVIPDPEIIEYTLDNNSRYMIIATDGIWEFLSNEKVMKIGNKFYPKYEPLNLCNELVKEANLCWEKVNVIRDDITVLVVYF